MALGDKLVNLDGLKVVGDVVGNLKSAVSAEVDVINGTSGLMPMRMPYVIDSAGKWIGAAAQHISISVSAGDIINIKAGSYSTTYSLLKSDNAAMNVNADFCDTVQSRIFLDAGANAVVTAPADCNVIVFAAKPSDNTYNQIPESILVNGIEQTYNIRAWISNVEDGSDKIDKKAESKASKNRLGIWGLRKSFGRTFEQVTLPSLNFLTGFNLPVYTDGYNYKHYIDLSKYKNESTNTVNVASSSELSSAITAATSGDTIILADGVYAAFGINKPLNIISKNAIVMPVVCGVFTDTAMSNVYKCTVSGTPTAVYDIIKFRDGIIQKITKTDNVNNLSTPGTWYISGTTLYLHMYDDRKPLPESIFCDSTSVNAVSISGLSSNGTVYLEGMTIFGGQNNIIHTGSATYSSQKLIAKDCKCYCANTSNAISLLGVNGYFQNCEAAYAYLDGINYHWLEENSSALASGLEVDCIAHDNGNTSNNQSCDGSSVHDGGKAVRIGGVYYHNHGGNIADISANTTTYNYDCTAFDSTADNAQSDPPIYSCADFWTYYNGTMYLYGCRAIGDSTNNLYAGGGGTITVAKSEYATKGGNVIDA